MRLRDPRRGVHLALLSLLLATACGRLEVVSLTRDDLHPCDRYTTAMQRFDLIANGINNRLADPVSAVLTFEDAALETYELLPDGTEVPDSAYVIYGDYLLALGAARDGDEELTLQYAQQFVAVTASVRASASSCGA
jgi:hypothetical protein